MDDVKAYLAKHPKLNSPFHKSPHVAGATTADLVADVAAHKSLTKRILKRVKATIKGDSSEKANVTWLRSVAKTAAAKARTKSMIVKEDDVDNLVADDQNNSGSAKTRLRVLN